MIFHPPEKFGYLGTPPPDTAVYIRPGSTAVHVAVDKPRIYNARKIYLTWNIITSPIGSMYGIYMLTFGVY